jgi:hypothetical protein
VLDCLDRFLYKGTAPIMSYYCPFTGERLTGKTYELALENTRSSKYETTDHAPIEIEVDGMRYLYVSLDNSVRANMNGFPLVASNRLQNICEMINTINPDVVFFSEACRKSFEGTMQEQKNIVHWFEMRQIISWITGMVHCCECANNFDENEMSFGVAVFAKQTALLNIKSVQGCNFLPMDISNECFGSGAVIVTTKNNTTVVGVHFPLDFKRERENNNNGRAMKALINLLDKYPKAYAFGDMNVIKGNIQNSMDIVLRDNLWKLSDPYYTYIGSFYDYAMDIKDQTYKDQTYKELTIDEINTHMVIPKK